MTFSRMLAVRYLAENGPRLAYDAYSTDVLEYIIDEGLFSR